MNRASGARPAKPGVKAAIAPPPDVLFLHRKLARNYLLCARINERVDVRACIDEVLDEGPSRVLAG